MLFVQESLIPNAGMGLFTDAPIKKGEIVIEYTGEQLTWAECEKRNDAQEGVNGYFFFVSKKICIDAQNTPESLGRYANDAQGYKKVDGLRNNAEYQIIKKKPYIVAKRNIKAGEEIFVSYGKEYWDVMKEYFDEQFQKKLQPEEVLETAFSEVA
jgi:SET domain-containing protein